MAAVPIVSVMVAFLLRNSFWAGPIAGFCYFLYTPLMFWFHRRVDRKRKEMMQGLTPNPFPGERGA